MVRLELSYEDLIKGSNPGDSPEDIVNHFFDKCEREYQDKNPCPKCGSHNTHFEPLAFGKGKSTWCEWCDDCEWKKITTC
jgi:hypothetical protein